MIKWLAGRLRAYLLGISLVLVLASGAVTPAGAGTPRQDIPIVEPELLVQAARSEPLDFMIVFEEQADLSAAYGMDWESRGWFVYETLTEFADQSQARVRQFLDRTGVSYQAFWAANLIIVEGASSASLNGLMNYTEIERLETLPQVMLMIPEDEWEQTEPVEEFDPEPEGEEGEEIEAPEADIIQDQDDAQQMDLMDESEIQLFGVESNISQIKADQVWGLGYTGTGLVVGSIDTGVRYTHNALVSQYRGNLDGGNYNHNYNWWDAVNKQNIPYDDNSHGTHTVGIMVGDDGNSNQIGVAPGASWMACKAFGFDGKTTLNHLLECGEFMLVPWDLDENNFNASMRPHVVNNSWGDCSRNYQNFYQSVVDAWLASGIYPVFANGNNSNCGYPSPPGLNTVGNPARYGNVTGVGSTGKNNGQYANHSNWGPTDNEDTINPRGFPNLKPQVVAPGVAIRSAIHQTTNNSYGFKTGTSMSAPHVAGMVALMWQAAPCLVGDYASTETIIEQTATPINYNDGSPDTPGYPNYATGWGEIDALAAVNQVWNMCASISGSIYDQEGQLVTRRLNVTATAENNPFYSRSTRSDNEGSYQIHVIINETYALEASSFHYAPDGTVIVAVSSTDNIVEDLQVFKKDIIDYFFPLFLR